MKKLTEIWSEKWGKLPAELAETSFSKLSFDSRKTDSETLFFALKGALHDGHDYLHQVAELGGKVAVVEKVQPGIDLNQIVVSDAHEVLGLIAQKFYGNPSTKFNLIGITGTNGKTTTTTLLFQLFRSMGHNCGLISTVENKINDTIIPSTHTTPDPIAIAQLMHNMAESNCTYVFMEVSSHAVHQKRIAGLNFDVAVFTNITHDHLDYHKTFAEYIKAKKAFFDGLPKTASALVNADDKNGRVMLQNCASNKYTFSLKTDADFKAKVLNNSLEGLSLRIDQRELHTGLIGFFNAYNLLCAYAVAKLLDQDTDNILQHLSLLQPVAGRFQQIPNDKAIHIVIDYAHTPDALENVLTTIKSFHDVQRIITVVGCGGDRDKTKRPIMAQVAATYSHQCIFTSDNPRSEDPEQILREMEAGLSPELSQKALTIADRKNAIKTAIQLAQKSDVVLIAGKGHEAYQEIKGIKHDFDDVAIAKTFLNTKS